jgi:two-component system sensor histidine kinase and response regulator WspE
LIDAALFEVFRAELDSHAETLTAELLALEKGAGGRIEPMMRAAHSIKGAARIVGIEPIVRLSHVMEDYFVAVQEGRIQPSRAAIDAMLRGVDLFQRASALTNEPPADWAAELGADVEAVLGQIERHAGGEEEPEESSDPFSLVREGAVVRVALKGDLVGECSELLRQRLVQQQAAGAKEAVLNVAAVADVDAAGLVLLQRLYQARAASPPLSARIEQPSKDFVLLLQACGLEPLLSPSSSN